MPLYLDLGSQVGDEDTATQATFKRQRVSVAEPVKIQGLVQLREVDVIEHTFIGQQAFDSNFRS